MLGVSTGLMYQGFVDSIAMSPNDINDNTDHTCLFWYDFTDASTMYTDTGSTNVSSDNDLICRIDNKSTATGGDRVTTYLQQLFTSKKPKYKTAGYASFNGTDEYLGGQRNNLGSYVGNAGTNCFSNQNSVDGNALSLFVVSERTGAFSGSSAQVAYTFDMKLTFDNSGNDDEYRLYYGETPIHSPSGTVHSWFFVEMDPGDGSAKTLTSLGTGVGSARDILCHTQPASSNYDAVIVPQTKSILVSPNNTHVTRGGYENLGSGLQGTVLGTDWYNYDNDTSKNHNYNIDFSSTDNDNYIAIGALNDISSTTGFWPGNIKHVILIKGDMYLDNTYQNLLEYLT